MTLELPDREPSGGTSGRWRRSLAAAVPPLERGEFWAVQVLVLLVAVLHSWVEQQHMLGSNSPLYLVPSSLYLVPVMYAAATFGLRGAALTALWAGALVALNLVLWHEGFERIGELLQVAWIGVAGLFVGHRVDRERAARLGAEAHEAALQSSEERYRDIVDNITEPIVVLDGQREVVQANRAAAALLGGDPQNGSLTLPSVVLSKVAQSADPAAARGEGIPAVTLGSPPRRFELIVTAASDIGQPDREQVLFRDVTAIYEREQGLEVVAREALAAREDEQQRIARELHDGPLQSVVQLWRHLDALEADMPAPDRQSVHAARTTAETVAGELRRFSRDLRPSVLDDLGISAAIRAEAESLGQRMSIGVNVTMRGRAERLEEDVELALLRIAQEALRNIEHHSGAAHVGITLSFSATLLELTIADDGSGLEVVPTTSELLARNHLGLIGMRERARLVGGRVDISETQGGGLTVAVSLPVHELPHR